MLLKVTTIKICKKIILTKFDVSLNIISLFLDLKVVIV